jgi:hypothetical protein
MADDKNNDHLNRRLMGRFCRFLQEMELTELHLNGRLYTWSSNEHRYPTLERIDRVFDYIPWCDLFPHHHLRAISSAYSDHAPLFLNTNISAPFKKRFRFETICPKLPGYFEAMQEGWNCPTQGVDACRALDIKFRSTIRSLQSWSQKKVGSVQLQLAVAKEVIFQLDHAQDRRNLSLEELDLRKELKFKCLGLTSVQRTIVRQLSRIAFLSEGVPIRKFSTFRPVIKGEKNL